MTPADLDLRSAAVAALGVLPDAGPPEARAAFFRKLGEYDMAPPPEAAEAALMLGALPGGGGRAEALDRFRRRRVEDAVGHFAAAYWQTPPAARRAAWDVLAAAAADAPRAADRLDRLRAGLDLEPPAVTGPAGDLARIVGEFYPLAPAGRAEARRAWLHRAVAAPGGWRRAAGELRRDHPAWAALAPDLFECLPAPPTWWERVRGSAGAGLRAVRAAHPESWVGVVAAAGLTLVVGLVIVVNAILNPRQPGTTAPGKYAPVPGKTFPSVTTRRP
jgi:hypothetical protein